MARKRRNSNLICSRLIRRVRHDFIHSHLRLLLETRLISIVKCKRSRHLLKKHIRSIPEGFARSFSSSITGSFGRNDSFLHLQSLVPQTLSLKLQKICNISVGILGEFLLSIPGIQSLRKTVVNKMLVIPFRRILPVGFIILQIFSDPFRPIKTQQASYHQKCPFQSCGNI